MFNALSRQKLREIIKREFPELESFADLLYETEGATGVKMADGSWTYIPVREGFSQGCHMPPVFVAMVLGKILKILDQEFHERAAHRKDQNSMDDNKGGVPIILAYVDDVNCLLPLEDVEDFLRRFKEIGEDLSAKMNTEKTQILTPTHN